VNSLIPLPLVRTAVGRSWNQIYRDAERGRLGIVSRIGARLYVAPESALAYAQLHYEAGGAALAHLLRPFLGRSQ
jgi:hypothetical protein